MADAPGLDGAQRADAPPGGPDAPLGAPDATLAHAIPQPRKVQPVRLVLAGDRRREQRAPGITGPAIVPPAVDGRGPRRGAAADSPVPLSPSTRLRRDTGIVLLLAASALLVVTSLPHGSTNGQVLDLTGTPAVLRSAPAPSSGSSPAAPAAGSTTTSAAVSPSPTIVAGGTLAPQPVVAPGATPFPVSSRPGPVRTPRPSQAPVRSSPPPTAAATPAPASPSPSSSTSPSGPPASPSSGASASPSPAASSSASPSATL